MTISPCNNQDIKQQCFALQNDKSHRDYASIKWLSSVTLSSCICSDIVHLNLSRTLNVSGMKIGPDSVKSLASGLEYCIRLQRLVVSSNNIDVYGAEALADALR